MKQFLKLGSFLLFFIAGCADNDKDTASLADQDDLNAGRNFIRATLDGDYARARTMILPDSVNLELINIYERSYNERMSPAHKEAYKNASISVFSVDSLNDSTSVIRYANSYFKKDTHQLKIMRVNNQWLVDFKSYFEDSTSIDQGIIDSTLSLPRKDSLP